MKSYARLTYGLIAGWFVFALAASALQIFKTDSNRIGFAVAIAAVMPILAFSLWFAASEKFRQFTLSLNPRSLTLAQSWRIWDLPSSFWKPKASYLAYLPFLQD